MTATSKSKINFKPPVKVIGSDGNEYEVPAAVAEKMRELEAKVEKLPKTADGVPVVPGMKVYVPEDDGYLDNDGYLVTGVMNFVACGAKDGEQSYATPLHDCTEDCDDWNLTSKCYSTRYLAQLAALSPQGASK